MHFILFFKKLFAIVSVKFMSGGRWGLWGEGWSKVRLFCTLDAAKSCGNKQGHSMDWLFIYSFIFKNAPHKHFDFLSTNPPSPPTSAQHQCIYLYYYIKGDVCLSVCLSVCVCL